MKSDPSIVDWFCFWDIIKSMPQFPGHQACQTDLTFIFPFFSSLFSSLYPLLNPGGWRHSAQHSRIHAFTQDDLFRTNCVHYTRRESEREREQTLFLSCEIKTLCMFAGPAGGHTHSQHTSLRLSAQRITFIKDSLKTTEAEDGQNSFLYLVLPCLVF